MDPQIASRARVANSLPMENPKEFNARGETGTSFAHESDRTPPRLNKK
jgi:hypothetical protein